LNKFIYIVLATLGVLFAANVSNAQKKWTLEECLDYALRNNLQMKQAELNIELSEQNLLQSKADALPSLNFNASHGYNWGQTIDPFTNTFASDRVRSNNLSLSTNVNLFNGFQRINTIKQNEIEKQVSLKDKEQLEFQLRVNVMSAFLQLLMAIEQEKISSNQYQATQKQLDRIMQLVKVGILPEINQYDIEAQLANDEFLNTNDKNQIILARLNLVQALQLSLDEARNFDILVPKVEEISDYELPSSAYEVYQQAQGFMPDIRSKELGKLSAMKQYQIAQGARMPSLNMNAAVGSGYSGRNFEAVGAPQFVGFDTIGFTGQSFEPVVRENFQQERRVKDFNDQLNDNFNRSLSFTLNIPIFNGWAVATNIKQAQIQQLNADLDYELARNNLLQDINRVLADAGASRSRYQSATKNYNSTKISYEFAETRFNQQLINQVEFFDIQMRYYNAQANLVNAKYEYLFRTIILDFYKTGKVNLPF
jgi:outer membrane protein